MAISQLQVRYLSVKTLEELKNNVNAFPADITLVEENHILYQYVEYADGSTIPTDDGVSVIQTNNPDLNSRWVAIDAYYSNILKNSFSVSDWVEDVQAEVYKITINFINPTPDFFIKVVDTDGKETLVQDITTIRVNDYVTSVVLSVGRTPDCRFNGTYTILKDRIA